jgi:hypothetical protein
VQLNLPEFLVTNSQFFQYKQDSVNGSMNLPAAWPGFEGDRIPHKQFGLLPGVFGNIDRL